MSVLIIDDEVELGSTLGRMIIGNVRRVHSIRDGIVGALDWQPEVVLLDVHFSNSDETGLEALKKIKAVSPLSKVIIITANYNDIDAVHAISNGAFGYSSKTDLYLIRALVLAARAAQAREAGQLPPGQQGPI